MNQVLKWKFEQKNWCDPVYGRIQTAAPTDAVIQVSNEVQIPVNQ